MMEIVSSRQEKFSPNYRDCIGLKLITPDDLFTVQQRARALTIDECYDYLCVEAEMLTPFEINCIKRAHKRGLAEGITVAIDNLFSHMKTRNGGQSCIAYLQQHARSFTVEPTSSPNNGFNFKITMNE